MSRREEVKKQIDNLKQLEAWGDNSATLLLTLADEVDTLCDNLLALGKKTTRYENEREINAGLVAERDTIIDKLLAMLAERLTERHLEDCNPINVVTQLHARACKIAGRVK